jgi:CRISPR-associated protein Cas2
MVSYDITDDRIRRKVSNTLEDFGQRVQYSVFECRLEESQFVALRMELTDLLQKEDSIRWYPLCKWCRDKVSWQGKGKSTDDEGFIIT